jgi:hypothetical protein
MIQHGKFHLILGESQVRACRKSAIYTIICLLLHHSHLFDIETYEYVLMIYLSFFNLSPLKQNKKIVGTWMPKDWGISGERLVMNLDMTFTDRQLYEREEFLGSMGGAKILHIKNNELTLAPTLTQGTRQIKVLDGGWRVAQGAGPMDTDLLRFYFEIEEQISRDGDVYCPKGRIYANCGYFPTNRQSSGFKERLKNDLDRMIAKAEALDDVIAAEGAFSLNKIKKQAELFRLKVDMQATGEKLMAASIAEPNDSLLKMSQDRSVGLTREGGICCKVPKGIAIEYHILGRFNIASMQSRDDL